MFNLGNHKKLPESFYLNPTEKVAKNLLGKLLVRKLKNKFLVSRIVETEAYLQDDEASHSYSGKTDRNKSMFLKGGNLYIYRIYGIHLCCNVVTGKENTGEAVLIRAVEPVSGIKEMIKNRGENLFGNENKLSNLTNGPAKLCKALEISLNDDGKTLLGDEIFILNNTFPKENIVQTTRIGISKATELPFRFYISGNDFVSRK